MLYAFLFVVLIGAGIAMLSSAYAHESPTIKRYDSLAWALVAFGLALVCLVWAVAVLR